MASKLLWVLVMVRSVISFAIVLGLAAPAFAQPGAEDEPPPPPAAPAIPTDAPAQATAANGAPINTPWNEVSHINGRLVPVGERDDYLVKNTKHWNISTNPIGFLVGFYGLSVAGAVTDNVVLRGNVEFFDYEFFGHTTGHEIALSAPIYFRRAFSGPFIEPGFVYQETMDTPWDLFGEGDGMAVAHTYAGPEMLFGWHWTFDAGFNIAAAIGVTRNLHESAAQQSGEDTASEDGPTPTGYLRVGYAF